MHRRPANIFLGFVALFTCSFKYPGDPAARAASSYFQGLKLFTLNAPTAKTDSTALLYFSDAIAIIEKAPAHTNDVLLFQSYVKKANLLDVKRDFQKAKDTYLKALAFQKRCAGLCDSIAFDVEVFAASSYYHLNNLDSANTLLLAAESLSERFPRLPDKERMYNALGALYFEKGNYQQSKNYFMKALETIHGRGPAYRVMEINFETNIASSLFKLDRYNESLAIYKNIIKLQGFPDYTYFNIGKVYAAMANYGQALASFRKARVKDNPGVLNEMANAHLQLLNIDSAIYYLDKYQWFNQGNKLSILDNGINKMYWADVFTRQRKFHEALTALQQAIVLFSGNFDHTDLYTNPSDFRGTFNHYNLFNALYKKATVLAALYNAVPDEKYLRLSLQTYQTALNLLQYIERSYDTDDSKIFLKKSKQEVYDKALETALSLYAKHPYDKFLEQAFLITEKNKASIISSSLLENKIEGLPEADKKLLAEQSNIKFQLAKCKINSGAGLQKASQLANNRIDYEIALSRVQKKLEQNHFYYHLKYDDSYPSVSDIQDRLQKGQALISFHASDNILHVFLVTHKDFTYFSIDSFDVLSRHIENWLHELKTNIPGRKFNGGADGRFIYEQLIAPVQRKAAGKHEWIIIPDGILCYLPFESLPAADEGKFLVETTEISYQLSSRFIAAATSQNYDRANNTILSFAPFSSPMNNADKTAGKFSFSQLPESFNEIRNLAGRSYLDTQATKSHFLQQMGNYSIIHLATHAVSDPLNSASSYIAFYPSGQNKEQDCLFLEELYGLRMDKTKLVIISACETGSGEWVNHEGIISIARGFSYAGCASTINSLWKADDKATSFIIGRFHQYLQKGYTKSRSLQLAKIDYIKSDGIYKTPNFWAHLILTGSNQPLYPSDNNRAVLLLSVLSVGAISFIVKKKTMPIVVRLPVWCRPVIGQTRRLLAYTGVRPAFTYYHRLRALATGVIESCSKTRRI